MNYKCNKLLLRQTRSASQTEVYLADDELVIESNLGRLFIIIEIFSKEKKTKNIIDQMIANLESDYYNSPTSDPETSLESTSQSFNLLLPELVDKPKNWTTKFNILMGVIKDQEIFLTSFGRFKTYLLRDNKMISIIPDNQNKNSNKSNKIFSQLISGEIEKHDILLFSNPTLFDYFSKEKIKKTCSTLNPEQTIEYFKNLLLENINPVSFAAVIFKFNGEFTKDNLLDEPLREFYGTQESMANLQNTERKTTKIMTANLWPNSKKMLEYIGKPFAKIKLNKSKLDQKINKTSIEEKKETATPEVKTQKKAIKTWHLNLLSNLGRLSNFPRQFSSKLKNLNKKSKKIALSLALLIIIFATSLFLINVNQKQKTKLKTLNNKLNEIDEQISTAEAALIYQDQEQAEQNLKNASSKLALIQTDNKDGQNRISELTKKIQTMLNKVYNIFEVEAETIIDFSQTITGFQIKKAVTVDNKIFVIGADQLFVVDPTQKSFSIIEQNFPAENIWLWNDDNLILTDNNHQISSYNLIEKTVSNKQLTFEQPPTLAVYTDRLYQLQPTNQQIVKIANPLSANPSLSNWYNDDPLIINKAQGITIDGDIWLWTNDGRIYRFYRGRDQVFEIQNLSSVLGNQLEVFTQTDWNKIFVLDKENNRLLIIRKSGVVEKQIKNNLLSSASNLQISADQTTAWVVSDAQIFAFDLTVE